MANLMLGKTDGRPPNPSRPRDGRHCDLCGCSQPAVRCDKCGCQIFCLSCDDMYHRHPKRRFHLRRAVDPGPPTSQARPVLPMKAAQMAATSPADPSKMPLPPPRKKKPVAKSFFDTFRRRSPSADNSPPLPKKEYSWTDRLGNIKKYMSNRPLPPLPDTNGHDVGDSQPSPQPTRHDMSFIHKRVDEKPPQLPQRSLKPDNLTREKENLSDRPVNNSVNMRNGTLDPSMMNRRFSGDENNWENQMQVNPQLHTLNRQTPQGYFPPGGPGYPSNLLHNMPQSTSATDLPSMDGYPGMPYPHYPHMPPFPYPPMYPPQQYMPPPPGYFGSSFANLPTTTTDGDFSDQSEASARPGKRFGFRKRAKRSQSVMMDRMAYPGQFFPFGPYPPGYGTPWGAAPYAMDAPPSPASSVRSLNRLGRSSRRRKKASAVTSEDDEEGPSLSSSPLSRPKSSSSERPPPTARKPPPPSSSEEEQEESEEEEEEQERNAKPSRRGSDPPKQQLRRISDPKRMPSPVPKSPLQSKKIPKQKKREISKHSDSEEVSSPTKLERQASRESNADQAETDDHPSTLFTPSGQWQCNHCTFINAGGSRICQVCCKTAAAETVTLLGQRPDSASPSSPEKKEHQDMAVLNSALDEAEEEINRGLQELMKLKEDFLPSKDPPKPTEPPKPEDPSPTPKPVYKSSGKMRTSILDKLNLHSNKTTSTETQAGGPSKTDKVIEARRPSTSSTTSDPYISPTAQSPVVADNANKRESACQTQTDDLMGFIERKRAEEDSSFFGRMNNGYHQYDRRDGMQSPRRDGMQSPRRDGMQSPVMYDRGFGGGFGMMQRSHSRASLFTGRMNDFGPLDYGLGPTPMYRSVSRSSLTGDYSDGRFSDFHNLRKPDYYLSMEELVERRRQESIRAQGLELVRMIREAEQQGFSADDIQVALTTCGSQNPLEWLQDNWRPMVENVVSLSASYASDKRENDVGVVSEAEARDALRMHKGNVWAAVTECVESRQRKFLELKARGKFKSKDITDALSSSLGDVENAYAKLTKSSAKPFLMRIWGAGEGVANQDVPVTNSEAFSQHPSYAKDNTDVEDVLSDEVWDEDYEEEVDWVEESEDEDEQGDLEDLRTCHEDYIKTPESDSEYADAFGTNTLERNMSSPGSDTFFVVPEEKKEKKGIGFLSKLSALRKEDKEKKSSKFYGSDLDVSSLDSDTKEDLNQESADQGKASGPLSVIKNTLSAIRDSVSVLKSDKKAPNATVERRTIIVKGKIEHESLCEENSSGGVKLVSSKPLKDDEGYLVSEESRQEAKGYETQKLKVQVVEQNGKKENETRSVNIVNSKEDVNISRPSTSGYVPPNKEQNESGSVQNANATENSKNLAQKRAEDKSPSPKSTSLDSKNYSKEIDTRTSEPLKSSNNITKEKNSEKLSSAQSNEISSKIHPIEIESLTMSDAKIKSEETLDSKLGIKNEKLTAGENKLEILKSAVQNSNNSFKGKEISKSSLKNLKKDCNEEINHSGVTTNDIPTQDEKPEDSVLMDDEFKKFPPVQSAVKVADSPQISELNTVNIIDSVEVKDLEMIDSEGTDISSGDNATNSPKRIIANEETLVDTVSSSAKEDSNKKNKSEEILIPPQSELENLHHLKPIEPSIKTSSSSENVRSTNMAKSESDSSLTKKDSQTGKISVSENLFSKEKLKSSSEKKNVIVRPKFKLVKLSKDEPGKIKESENKKLPSPSLSKTDLNSQANAPSTSQENQENIEKTSTPIPDYEIYPPDIVEKIKQIPISSESSPKKVESQSEVPPKSLKNNATSESTLQSSMLPLESVNGDSNQKVDSKSLESNSALNLQHYQNDLKTEISSLPLATSNSEAKIPEFELRTELKSETTLSPVKSSEIHQSGTPTSSASIQHIHSSESTYLSVGAISTASPDPIKADNIPSAEPNNQSKSITPTEFQQSFTKQTQQQTSAASTEPTQKLTSTASPEPNQEQTPAASPEPTKNITSAPSAESNQQQTPAASPEPTKNVTSAASTESNQQQTHAASPEPTKNVTLAASTESNQKQTSAASPEPSQKIPSASDSESSQAPITTQTSVTDHKHSKDANPENESVDYSEKSPAQSIDSASDVPIIAKNNETPTPENSGVDNATEEDEESSDDSRGNSLSPPNPVDTLRNRYEGLMDPNHSTTGTVRPQSPFRRMSFRSTKAIIALERTRDSSAEKPWFLPKPAPPEVKKAAPKRSIKQQLEMDRRVRQMVTDRKCRTYRKAEIVVQLMDMHFEEEEALQAANDCSTLEKALSYLQQECLLCTGSFPVSHIISMVHCPHKACRECLRAYFTVQIRDRNIMELLCPFCNEPDIFDEDVAQDYFNHLDIMLKKLVDPEIHELFQRKLRDRVLMRDPNFKWCSQCSSGFIAMENLKRLVCPDCNAVTCASCRRPWEREHQGISCDAFAAWKDAVDPEAQTISLAKLLTEEGIDCPRCHFRYQLAKGGCMHFRCTQCQHDFCSGCSKPFKMGQKCGVSEFCGKLGLHAHHPRNCLFYLRDKDPEDLQRLLDLSGVKYDKEPSDKQDKNTCQVLEQKETADGLVDDFCSKDVEQGFAGLCRLHYVEYLGQLVNKHKVDPIQIFEKDDLELVLRRANIRLPPKRYRESDDQYKEKLMKKCGVSEFCGKLGLHAHHPRNCLFYLRDKDPEDLQRLLDLSGVKYDKEPSDKQDKNTCQVLEQKETADGLVDDFCSKDVEQGFAGLCRLHYVEYLGQLVNKHKVDPIQIFEKDDLELVLRRANIRLPPKRYRESDDQYKEKLMKLIQDELPLDKVEGS